MGQDRRRRRLAAKGHLKLLHGGAKTPGAPLPGLSVTAPDRLGQAILVLIQKMREMPERCEPAAEVKVLLQVAAKLAEQLGADADQFAAVAQHEFLEYLSQPPPAQPGA